MAPPGDPLAAVGRNLAAGVSSVVVIDSLGAIVFAAALLLSSRRFFPNG